MTIAITLRSRELTISCNFWSVDFTPQTSATFKRIIKPSRVARLRSILLQCIVTPREKTRDVRDRARTHASRASRNASNANHAGNVKFPLHLTAVYAIRDLPRRDWFRVVFNRSVHPVGVQLILSLDERKQGSESLLAIAYGTFKLMIPISDRTDRFKFIAPKVESKVDSIDYRRWRWSREFFCQVFSSTLEWNFENDCTRTRVHLEIRYLRFVASRSILSAHACNSTERQLWNQTRSRRDIIRSFESRKGKGIYTETTRIVWYNIFLTGTRTRRRVKWRNNRSFRVSSLDPHSYPRVTFRTFN